MNQHFSVLPNSIKIFNSNTYKKILINYFDIFKLLLKYFMTFQELNCIKLSNLIAQKEIVSIFSEKN